MIKKRLQTQLRDLVQTFDDENGETFYWYKFVTQNKSTLHFLLGMHNGLHNFGKIIKQYYNKQIHNKVIISFGNESLYQFEDADLKPISIFKLLHRWADEANVPLAIIEFRNGNQSIAETYNAWCNDKGITQRLGMWVGMMCGLQIHFVLIDLLIKKYTIMLSKSHCITHSRTTKCAGTD